MMPRKPLALALGLGCVVAAAGPAAAQVTHERPFFGRSLLYGSGAIVTPTATVPSAKLSIAGTANAYFVETAGGGTAVNEGGSVTLGLLGVIEGGLSVYSPDDAALYGKLMLVHGTKDYPAVAVGVLNVTDREVGRFGNPDPLYDDIVERWVGYVVGTYRVEPSEDDRPIWLEFSAGWGSGFFVEDNPAYTGDLATSGVFGSLALEFKIGRDHFLRFMVEHDAWNVNAGAMLMIGGAELSAGVLALDGSTDPQEAGADVNQARPYVALTLDLSVLRRWPLIWKPRI